MSRKIIQAIFLLLVALFALACGKIQGKVTLENGTGIEGVTIIMDGDSNKTTITDSEGNYKFDSLKDGSYTIEPSLEEYSFEPENKNVTLTKDENEVNDVDFIAIPSSIAWPGTIQSGSTEDDFISDMAFDSDNNIYLVGYSYGDLHDKINLGNADIILIKYNLLGEKQWTLQFGTNQSDCGSGIAIDNSDNIYIAGYTYGNLDGNNSSNSSADIILTKVNTSGEIEWIVQHGSVFNDADYGTAVTTDNSGNIFVTGYTYGSLDGIANPGGADGRDIFLLKYNSFGVREWTRTYGKEEMEYTRAIAIDSQGNICIAGSTINSLDGNTNAGGIDVFIVKYNTGGERLWTQMIGSEDSDSVNFIAIDNEDNIYFTGETSGNFDENAYLGNRDAFLVKYNSSGIKQWTRMFSTDESENGTGVIADNAGSLYLTGRIGGVQVGSSFEGNVEAFIAKYTDTGEILWMQTTGGPEYDCGMAIGFYNTNNIFITGFTDGSFDGNTSAGNRDFFLMKYNSSGVKQ